MALVTKDASEFSIVVGVPGQGYRSKGLISDNLKWRIFMKDLIKHFAGTILGWSALYYYIFRFGGYVGRQKIHARLQGDSHDLIMRALCYIIEDPMGKAVADLRADYFFVLKNIDNPRLTQKVIEQYSTDDLMGYGDYNYDKGGVHLHEQQRGLILPAIEGYLSDQSLPLTVCELGTGNGDILAHLAAAFPQHKFVGVDFSVKIADQKHRTDNLSFVKGYALDLLERGDIKPDIVIASSTMCLFTPLELCAYLKAAASAKVFFVNEPSWGGLKMDETQPESSQHLEGALWFHNYPAYFSRHGYKNIMLRSDAYKHHKSSRPDIYVNLAQFVR